MSEIRKFRIIVNLKECGTCSGSSPSSVAKKAVKKLCDGSKKIITFSLKECKRDCKKECGPYQGHMEKLDKPYKRKGKTITHKAVCEKIQVKKMNGGLKNNVTTGNNETSKNTIKHIMNSVNINELTNEQFDALLLLLENKDTLIKIKKENPNANNKQLFDILFTLIKKK